MPFPPAKCAVCDHDLTPDARFCASCGTPTPAAAAGSDADLGDTPARDFHDEEFESNLRRVVGSEYELLELIGQGGFARVHKARDRRLGRLVAIKVIRPDLAGAQAFLDRFRREGVALAKLRHPGVVPIYDIREADGLIYYVMPFVEGENLRARLNRLGRLPPFEAHRILSELSDAIGAAHRAGIVHRDIKPENIILEGNLRKVLLMDFGIAKALTGEAERLTGSGMLVGTPQYMSPEQAAGAAEIDHRSDIYSLGVVGYHMVTGKLPFEGTTSQEVIVQHMTETPVPVRQINPSVPKSLSDTITRCLAKDPAERFGSAMELWSQLQTVSFFREPAERKSGEIAWRPRTAVVAGSLLLGVVVGMLLGRVVFRAEPPVSTEPTAQFAAVEVVSEWLNGVAKINDAPDVPAARLAATGVFDSGAIVTRIVTGSDQAFSTLGLTPAELVSNGSTVALLTSLASTALEGQRYGTGAVVVGSYRDSLANCGTASFTMRSSDGRWMMHHVLLRDFGRSCKSASESRGSR